MCSSTPHMYSTSQSIKLTITISPIAGQLVAGKATALKWTNSVVAVMLTRTGIHTLICIYSNNENGIIYKRAPCKMCVFVMFDTGIESFISEFAHEHACMHTCASDTTIACWLLPDLAAG